MSRFPLLILVALALSAQAPTPAPVASPKPPAVPTPAAAVPAQPAATVPVPILSPGEIVAAAPAGDWVDIAAYDMLVMDLAPDAAGGARRVVIQLMPAPFSQGWIGNIRRLAAERWWDGTSINRMQDNYVVQWGDATEKKAVPAGLATMLQADYIVTLRDISMDNTASRKDAFAASTGFEKGWPVASANGSAWPVHCYGMVGVGRDMPPNTGTGAELYTVIGHAPRHLDRNIALVGRVISGIEQLSSLPRGTAALGFYEKPEQRVAITSIRLASDLPAAERPKFQYLSTESATFARYADARANRRDAFFIVPAGGADICNVPVPVRKAQ